MVATLERLRGQKFLLGRTVMTPGVQENIGLLMMLPKLIARHAAGDCGDMCDEDKEANDRAIESGDLRVFSSYKTPHGKIWIITEADRSATTSLLPDEY